MSKPQHVAPSSGCAGTVSRWRLSSRKPAGVWAIVFALAASGCAGVPFDAPKTPSAAEPPARASRAGRVAAPWLDGSGKSGFVPIGAGEAALGARLRLIEEAEHSIDAQYFLMKADLSAALIAQALIEAADRGVRVRFLLDDVFTTASDESLAILDARPNLEVRIFNPVSRSGPQWLAFLRDFSRTNRRMHNKSFIVDGSMVIVGGRNIADEYYAVEQEIEFADFDVFGAGPVAMDVSRSFDLFWNSNLAVPLDALIDEDTRVAAAESRIGDRAEPLQLARAREVYDGAVEDQLFRDLRAGRIEPIDGYGIVVTDSPAKLGYPVGSGLEELFSDISSRMEAAKREIVIVTPYFVPRREGVALLKSLRERGIDIIVITNSLASTNHPYVHGGYFPYRKELLEAGVRIYEAKADAAISQLTGEPVSLTLHTKAILIDRETVFIGSLNYDPRSIELNTEMGVFIESPEFGAMFAEAIEDDMPAFVYEVGLDADGRTVWRYGDGDSMRIWRSEPGASGWEKFVARITSLLPVEDQL